MPKRRAGEQSGNEQSGTPGTPEATERNSLTPGAPRVPRNSLEEGGSQIDDIRSNLKAEAQFGDYLTRPEAMEWSSTETESAETAFGTALNTKLSEVKDMGEGQKDVEMQGDEVGGSKEKETEEKGTEEKGDDTEEEERPSKRRRSHAEEGAGSGRYSMFY